MFNVPAGYYPITLAAASHSSGPISHQQQVTQRHDDRQWNAATAVGSSQAAPHDFFTGDSPTPIRPHPYLPTPKQQQQQPSDALRYATSTPASRRTAAAKMMSPDAEIADRLAGLWVEYVGRTQQPEGSRHEAHAYTQPTPLAPVNKRWMHRRIQTPLINASVRGYDESIMVPVVSSAQLEPQRYYPPVPAPAMTRTSSPNSGPSLLSSHQPLVSLQPVQSAYTTPLLSHTQVAPAPTFKESFGLLPSDSWVGDRHFAAADRSSSRTHFIRSPSVTGLSLSQTTQSSREAVFRMEERERAQRDHVRFLEQQMRKGIAARCDVEAPLQSDYRRNGSATSLVMSNTSLSFAPPNSFAWSGMNVSPQRRGYMATRLESIAEDERSRRRDVVDAEHEVWCALQSVVMGLHRHAMRTEERHALHRALTIAVGDEQAQRKKIEALETHVFSTLNEIFRGASTALVGALYERVKLFTSSSTNLVREECKQRLVVVDEEVVSRRQLLLTVHEAELAMLHTASRKATAHAQALQRVLCQESELRYGLLQDEDQVRADVVARWSHEKAVLDHIERQRYGSVRSLLSKASALVDSETPARLDIMDVEAKLRGTLSSSFRSATARQREVLHQIYEREWRETLTAHLHAQLLDLSDREGAVREQVLGDWCCVVAALEEWRAELKVQTELEASYAHQRRLAASMEELQDTEHSARLAVMFSEDVVHKQHAAWAVEFRAQIASDVMRFFSREQHRLVETEKVGRSVVEDEEVQRRLFALSSASQGRVTVALRDTERIEVECRVRLFDDACRDLRLLHGDWKLQRDNLRGKESEHRRAVEQFQMFLRTYESTEQDTRTGVQQTESIQRASLIDQYTRHMDWLQERAAALRVAFQRASDSCIGMEEDDREDIVDAASAAYADLKHRADAERLRLHEEQRAAMRQLHHQVRTSMLTLGRLEDVQRDVIRGAELRESQIIEQRHVELQWLFQEEHARLLRTLDDRRRRTFDEKRSLLMDDEAVARAEVEDTEAEVRHHHVYQQFHLRTPLLLSDSPQVLAFLKQECKARLDVEDMFTYERWNLSDLEAMSRGQIEATQLPVNLAATLPPSATGSSGRLSREVQNEFAAIVAESDVLGPPRQPSSPQPPEEWTFDEASRRPLATHSSAPPAVNPQHMLALRHMLSARVSAPAAIPGTATTSNPVASPLRLPPKAPSSRILKAVGPSATGAASSAAHHVTELLDQEAARRKRLVQEQFQTLASIIQHNIESLPAA